jgi:hypothetical protein
MNTEATDALAEIKISVDPEKLDEEQFCSLWDVASSTMGGDYANTRTLAGRMLGFLCKKRCPFVVVSPTDATYLDELFERENSLLYDWKPESEKVDILAQHAFVPYQLFANFLENEKFNAKVNHSPTRANRVDWFTNDWVVG